MMSFVPTGNVVVLSGQTDSPAMKTNYTVSDATHVAIKSPATLPETATLQVSYDFDVDYDAKGQTLAAATAAATWQLAPVSALGAAGAAVHLAAENFLANAWRIHLSGAAGADRSFILHKRVYGPIT